MVAIEPGGATLLAPASGPRPPLTPAAAAEHVQRLGATAAVLVEGWSDLAAVQALAQRRGIDLPALGTCVLPIGGITNLGKFIDTLGPAGLGLGLSGLCDAAQAPYLERTLRRAGLSGGFFVCEADLEDELIRAVGAPAILHILHSEGELASFRTFQNQPEHRGSTAEALLHRFMGTRARRKVRYGTLLVDALSLERVPQPLDQVLARAAGRR